AALRHDCANTGMNLQDAFRYQMHDHLMSCIGIDLQAFAEFSHGGKSVTGPQLSCDHGLLRGIHNLLVKRDTWLERHTEWDHLCVITASTPYFKESVQGIGGASQAESSRRWSRRSVVCVVLGEWSA